MGLGKVTRGAGKVAAAIQVGLLLADLGGALLRRIRGQSAQPAPDGARAHDDAAHYADGSDHGDNQRLQP